MDIPGFECSLRGSCCREKRIHLTLTDLVKLAEYLCITPREAMERYTEEDPQAPGMLKLRKQPHGDCLLRLPDQRCSVHPAKPTACELYICDTSLKSKQGYPWPLLFNNPEGLAYIARRSAAQEVTEEYVEAHGVQWNEDGFSAALAEIDGRIAQSRRQTIRAARLEDDSSAFIMFDCPQCTVRSSCCKDRPLTLDDIRTIAPHLGITVEDFFAQHVSQAIPEAAQGTLALRKTSQDHCSFLDPGTNECRIPSHQPLHCRLMPCPILAGQPDINERYLIGAGSLADQFRYSVATAITRRYTAQHGPAYDPEALQKHLRLLDTVLQNEDEFHAFCTSIQSYRYPQETDQS